MNHPDPTGLALLRDAESYLSALHGSVARHDNLAANFGCAGCELRDRIAEVLWPLTDWDGDQSNAERAADAVFAVLPPPADRAAILREAISAAEDEARHLYDDMGQKAAAGGRLVADRLRRLADEAQPTTEAQPQPCAHCGKTIRRITGTLTEWWVHIPGGQALCYPWQPARSTRATPKAAAGARQDGVQQ